MNAGEIQHILKRKPISPAQLALFKVLYYADQPLTFKSIAFMICDGHVNELRGVLGALTNRIDWTEGVEDLPDPAYRVFFDVETINGVKHYTMRPELREAIEGISTLRKVLERFTVSEIYERYDHGESYWLNLTD